MTLLVPNDAELIILETFLNKAPSEDLIIHLYASDTSPSETDLVGTYTEVTGGGYSAQNLTAASWVVVPGNPTAATHPITTFAFTAGVGNVYGYYVTQVTSGKLMWSERFVGAPVNIQNNGDQIVVTPKITVE
jgi:hypothetical protein